MTTIVQKYGGTSMGTIEKIKSVANKVILEKEKGNDVVVVVSAMGKTTNKLVDLAKEISINPNKREFDMLLSTGEQISISLLAIAIQSYGYDAISFTGYQAGIKTKGTHTKSEIVDIDIERIKENLEKGKIVIVAGFQGVNEKGDIVTLGRGGSDTTAVALAAKLGCSCTIYTDVEGIYSVDPKFYPNSKKIDCIGYKEMIEMSRLGAGVMETTSVEIGYKNNVPIYVASSNKDIQGTCISESYHSKNDKPVIGISIDENISMIKVDNISLQSKDLSEIVEILYSENLTINMMNKTVSNNSSINLSLIVSKGDLGCVDRAIDKIELKLGHVKVIKDLDVSMISIVGKGISSDNDTINKIFELLINNNIEFKQVSISNLSISFVLKNDDRKNFIELIGNEFNL